MLGYMDTSLPPLVAVLRPGMPVLGVAQNGDRIEGMVTRVRAPFIEVDGLAYRADSMSWHLADAGQDAADL